jgi:hypothetical protein
MYICLHVKQPFCQISMKLEFLREILKNVQIQNFTKFRPVGAELFHADGQTDRHDEANSTFRNFANATKNVKLPPSTP